VYSYIVI